MAVVGDPSGDLKAGNETEFAENVLDMRFRCTRRDDQDIGDLPIGLSLKNEPCHFLFPFRQSPSGTRRALSVEVCGAAI
jgi:hypothetical protein